jgi:hypothetical protein
MTIANTILNSLITFWSRRQPDRKKKSERAKREARFKNREMFMTSTSRRCTGPKFQKRRKLN